MLQSSYGLNEQGCEPKVFDIVGGRRAFIKALGLGAAGAALLGVAGSQPASAQALTDVDIQNFALNFEYLGAEFYLRASVGQGLTEAEVTGSVGTLGPVAGGRQVPFATRYLANFANELAVDERAHVNTLRQSLGSNAIARPQIDLGIAFTYAARGAGVIGPNDIFDPFADEISFLLGAFIFEDVCVTALAGAAPLLQSKQVLSVAAGFLGVESYQAGAIRTFLTARGLFQPVGLISDARGRLDGVGYDDQGIADGTTYNITPTDVDGLVFARTPQEVLRIAYLNTAGAPSGFFPMGVNGTIR